MFLINILLMFNLKNHLDIVILDYERDPDKDSYSVDGDIHKYNFFSIIKYIDGEILWLWNS